MTVALSAFTFLVRGRLQNCPNPIMEQAVLETAIEFCKRTEPFIENDISIVTVADQRGYTISPSAGTAYETRNLIRDADDKLDASSRQEFEENKWDILSGTPVAYYIEGDGKLMLGPIPDAVETLTLVANVIPAADATTLNDELYNSWRETIAAGARAHVRKHYEKWADLVLEAKDMEDFEMGIARANMKRFKGGNDKTRRRTKGYYF